MAEFCVLAVSGDRAKIFTTRDAVHAEVESGPNLIESAEMQIVIDAEEADGGFARSEACALSRKLVADSIHLLRRNNGRTLVLAAPPAMLAILREACSSLGLSNISVLEYEGDVLALSPQEVQITLSRAGVMPQSIAPAGLSRD